MSSICSEVLRCLFLLHSSFHPRPLTVATQPPPHHSDLACAAQEGEDAALPPPRVTWLAPARGQEQVRREETTSTTPLPLPLTHTSLNQPQHNPSHSLPFLPPHCTASFSPTSQNLHPQLPFLPFVLGVLHLMFTLRPFSMLIRHDTH